MTRLSMPTRLDEELSDISLSNVRVFCTRSHAQSRNRIQDPSGQKEFRPRGFLSHLHLTFDSSSSFTVHGDRKILVRPCSCSPLPCGVVSKSSLIYTQASAQISQSQSTLSLKVSVCLHVCSPVDLEKPSRFGILFHEI